jgi:predicted nucleic acid-binding protein
MIIVSDSGPIISLAIIDKLDLLEKLYNTVSIPEAVWQELSVYIEPFNIPQVLAYKDKVVKLESRNNFINLMDIGESEAVSLYHEMNADFLLIDDKAARHIAESFSVQCIGTLAILVKAKQLGLIPELRSLFIRLLATNRF